MPEITAKFLKKVSQVCYKISFKTGVAQEDLYSECLSKIPNLLNNFDERAETDFEAYALLSMRFYCLNYCRDKSFLSGVGRANLLIYNKSLKFPNLEIAASSMMVDYDKLITIHKQVKELRRYNSINIDDEWRLETSESTPDVTEVLRRYLTDEEIEYAYDVIVDKKKSDSSKIADIIAKIKNHEEELRCLI